MLSASTHIIALRTSSLPKDVSFLLMHVMCLKLPPCHVCAPQEEDRAIKVGMADGSGADATIDSLREDVESALAEAALAQERQQLLQLEVTDLQRQVKVDHWPDLICICAWLRFRLVLG